MSDDVVRYLKEHGPTRAGAIADEFVKKGVKAEAARQRISRARAVVHRFPVDVLPKREQFLYLPAQRNKEAFWRNLVRDMRATNSVFGVALDGLAARGGFVTEKEFAIISAAYAYPQRGQVTALSLAKSMQAAELIHSYTSSHLGPGYALDPRLGIAVSDTEARARRIGESVILDGLREWARKIGLAAYNSIAIRGEDRLKAIGPFSYDLAGPSYLSPLHRGKQEFGFLVADVIVDRELNLNDIQFFIRKARMSRSAMPDAGVLAILVGERFTGEALTAGHRAGIMLATPQALFGRRAGAAITSLVETLKNAAAYAASSPERLLKLVDDLSEIEGRAGNLRGILFELMAGYLARRTAVSIDMGTIARHPETGKTVDMDVVAVTAQRSALTIIECKAKEPGGSLSLEEVDIWLAKIPVMRAFYSADPYWREARLNFEIWTTGSIDSDALEKLEKERARRTQTPLSWKSGQDVLDLAKTGKEKAMVDALYQHFIRNPLAEAAAIAPTTGLIATPSLDIESLLAPLPATTEFGTKKKKKPWKAEDFPMLPPPRTYDRIDDFED